MSAARLPVLQAARFGFARENLTIVREGHFQGADRKQRAGNPFSDLAFDPNQVRDEKGRWTDGVSGLDSDWVKNLSPRQQRLLRDHSEFSYLETNDALRRSKGKGKAAKADAVRELDEVLNNAHLPQTILYRAGVMPDLEKLFYRGKFQGAIFTDHGYASTSRTKEIFDFFGEPFDPSDPAGASRPEGIPFHLTISIPEGTRGGYIAPISSASYEEEVLLARGTWFRVDNWSLLSQQGVIKVDATVIKQS